MKRRPITHLVEPSAADAWVARAAKPPGPGFTALTKRNIRSALAWWRRNMRKMAR